ncbi:MAG: Fic family protein [Candidatus Saccharimonadales bacterium]|nr:Fic family protein [Candidatus Saccharibacteria bacterium]
MSKELDRQRSSGSFNKEEREYRRGDAAKFIDAIIGRHAEYFSDAENRLEFVRDQDPHEFLRLARFANANLRGERWGKLRYTNERGSFLKNLHTPAFEDKVDAFCSGFRAIQEYIQQSDDPQERKLRATGMAIEALIIWTHPFNDGNGRTSRFMASLIESGVGNTDTLLAETISNVSRQAEYPRKRTTKEAMLHWAAIIKLPDIDFDDDTDTEVARLEALAETLPNDVDGMYNDIKYLLDHRLDTLDRERKERLSKFAEDATGTAA